MKKVDKVIPGTRKAGATARHGAMADKALM